MQDTRCWMLNTMCHSERTFEPWEEPPDSGIWIVNEFCHSAGIFPSFKHRKSQEDLFEMTENRIPGQNKYFKFPVPTH